jgi:hypothetical protein
LLATAFRFQGRTVLAAAVVEGAFPMFRPASAPSSDRSLHAGAWLHWLWRLAVLAALLWIGWELDQGHKPTAGGGSMQIAALSQQVSDAQARLDDIDGALDDVQDALDRIESAVEDDDDGTDDAISKQAVLRPPAATAPISPTAARMVRGWDTAWRPRPARAAQHARVLRPQR